MKPNFLQCKAETPSTPQQGLKWNWTKNKINRWKKTHNVCSMKHEMTSVVIFLARRLKQLASADRWHGLNLWNSTPHRATPWTWAETDKLVCFKNNAWLQDWNCSDDYCLGTESVCPPTCGDSSWLYSCRTQRWPPGIKETKLHCYGHSQWTWQLRTLRQPRLHLWQNACRKPALQCYRHCMMSTCWDYPMKKIHLEF